MRVRWLDVQDILCQVHVEGGQVVIDKVDQELVSIQEVVIVKVGPHFFQEVVEFNQHVLVDTVQLLVGNCVISWLKVAGVSQEEAEGVPQFPVGFGNLLEGSHGNPDVGGGIGTHDPEPDNFSPHLLDHLVRVNDVPHRLRHLLPLLVEGEALGNDSLVRSLAGANHTGDQAGVEPTTVLVRPFQVEVGWVGQVVPFGQHSLVGGTGVEPHVHDVGFLGELPVW